MQPLFPMRLSVPRRDGPTTHSKRYHLHLLPIVLLTLRLVLLELPWRRVSTVGWRQDTPENPGMEVGCKPPAANGAAKAHLQLPCAIVSGSILMEYRSTRIGPMISLIIKLTDPGPMEA